MRTSEAATPSKEATSTAPMTRRERQRQATYDEIVSVARGLLRKNEALSLRGIAGVMGLTAPALYRYVDSYQELLMLVCRAVFHDVVAALTVARLRHPDDDPAAQILASAVAFRRWAMDNPAEFGLVFANPQTAESTSLKLQPGSGGAAFGEFFADIYGRLWDRYRFPIPADGELDPAVLETLQEQQGLGTLACDFPGLPIGLSWIFIRAWARLYGTVTLEVFRHLDAAIIDSGALFRAMLEDNGRELGFGDDWPRLRELVATEMSA